MSTSSLAIARRPTRVVRVGDLEIGGTNPIRVQSMTTTDTRDIAGTVGQIERLVDAGCELVRITTPSQRDVLALGEIRALLERRRVRVPLVADVHFTPNAAIGALEHVDKVRINPGNFADRKHFAVREYSDEQYATELERVADRFRPLVVRARELGRALRIGTNHGSLSDRILNRHGETPAGMVESALEFFDVCEAEDFRDVIFSMKSSNPKVTLLAYRLLARRLDARPDRHTSDHVAAPLHLGVTEAGAGVDARVKSAIGIGTLLEEGLGDTIRVSLTEDPVREIPVARALAERFETRFGSAIRPPGNVAATDLNRLSRPDSESVSQLADAAALGPIAIRRPVRVDLELGPVPKDSAGSVASLAGILKRAGDRACEGLVIDVSSPSDLGRAQDYLDALASRAIEIPVRARTPLALAPRAANAGLRVIARAQANGSREELLEAAQAAASAGKGIEWEMEAEPASRDPADALDDILEVSREAGLEEFAISVASDFFIHAHRRIAQRLAESGLEGSVALRHRAPAARTPETALLHAATDLGALLCEGIGHAVSLRHDRAASENLDLLYRILQGARVRITRAEYISCPSCGRTQFDLERVTELIRGRTSHLRDVKIAIMGCIVNGPGEMADADFGYVGSGPGKVHLYVGHERVAAHIVEADAPDRLEELIRTHGRWIEPPEGALARRERQPPRVAHAR